jgi:hypothetical protein
MKRISLFSKKSSLGDDEEDDDPNDNHNHGRNTRDDDAWNPSLASALPSSASSSLSKNNNNNNIDEFGMNSRAMTSRSKDTINTTTASNVVPTNARPNYRGIGYKANRRRNDNDDDDDYDDEDDRNLNLPEDHDDDDEDEDNEDYDDFQNKAEHIEKSAGTSRLNRILRDASTMSMTTDTLSSNKKVDGLANSTSSMLSFERSNNLNVIEKVSNPRSIEEVGHFVGRVVIPPLRVDATTIGGHMLDTYPISMQQECLYTGICHNFESSTGTDMINMSALQYPNEYGNRKRSLGLFSTSTTTNIGNKYRTSKIRYIVIGRSTNRPLLQLTQKRQMEVVRKKQLELLQNQYLQERSSTSQQQQARTSTTDTTGTNKANKKSNDDSERGDYDTMFSPEDIGDDDDEENMSRDLSMNSSDGNLDTTDNASNNITTLPAINSNDTSKRDERRKSVKLAIDDDMDFNETMENNKKQNVTSFIEDEEISSFPVLICMTLQNDGTGPDIRKLIPLDQLTTVQDLNSTVVQLAFTNGDTIRIDFGNGTDTNDDHLLDRKINSSSNKNITMERSLDKERFIWSILQIHAMLCMSVVERNSRGTSFLSPLNVRNVDRAELQYIATINGFIKNDETIRTLLERQRKLIHDNETSIMMMTTGTIPANNTGQNDKEKPHQQQQLDMDEMAYDLMMGNFATRVTLFHSEDERKDAEEILNSPEWTEMLNSTMTSSKDEAGTSTNSNTAINAMNVAERLTYVLQSRMRDLEAETCRRLIAWEDEKHVSLSGRAKLHDASDARDTVDALALASLFKTLESLDSELKAMEDWLQDRAAAIKPLTDDCADIEEENRQLEQQWKSYDMLGNEMKRLLHGQELDETTETILKNPASVLVYDEDGLVVVDESEDGIERLYEAGKALLDAIEFVS